MKASWVLRLEETAETRFFVNGMIRGESKGLAKDGNVVEAIASQRRNSGTCGRHCHVNFKLNGKQIAKNELLAKCE